MCITVAPADLTSTALFSLKEKNRMRTLIYTNKAESSVDKNMMLIALPCLYMDSIVLTDLTGQGETIMKQVYNFRYENSSTVKHDSRGVMSKGGLKLEKVGMYEVCYSKNLEELKAYCDIPEPITHFYSKYSVDELMYFGFVWYGKEPISSQPICITYDAGDLWNVPYFPMLDRHDKNDDINSLINSWTSEIGISYDHFITYGEDIELHENTKRTNNFFLGNKVYHVNCFNYTKSWHDYSKREHQFLNGDYYVEDNKLHRVAFTSGDTKIFN
jgi:hypothetical protein